MIQMHSDDLLCRITSALGNDAIRHEMAMYLLGLAAEEIKRLKASEDYIKQVEFPRRVARVKAHFDRELENIRESMNRASEEHW